jgi:hypothetical protein
MRAKTITGHDKEVERQASGVLARHPHFRGCGQWIHCRCRRNVLKLNGMLPSFYLKQEAQEAVRDIRGVRRNSNRIKVANPNGCVLDGTDTIPTRRPRFAIT